MKQEASGLAVGEFMFARLGGAAYAQDSKNNLYKRVCPGVYYIAKTRPQIMLDVFVSLVRLAIFAFVFWLFDALPALLSIKAVLIWLALLVYVRIGGGK